jgi:3-deoxy-manno-octulosonate cytidylyltransferase (CMP-KDO synthetase)
MPVYGLIPARLESSRLPRKLLLDRTGKPLLQYAWEAAIRASSLDEVIVATDSAEIAQVVRRFGGRAEMTGPHNSGSDRIAEVVKRCCKDAEIVVNVQGDEPELNPAEIDRLVAALRLATGAEMATLATPIRDELILQDPGCVKVVCAADGRALYFSRAPIPFVRDASPSQAVLHDSQKVDSPWLLHIGIYAYRPEFLLAFTRMPPGRLEQLEKLEQLRALEAGAGIQVVTIPHASVGIDTREDYARFVERHRG